MRLADTCSEQPPPWHLASAEKLVHSCAHEGKHLEESLLLALALVLTLCQLLLQHLRALPLGCCSPGIPRLRHAEASAHVWQQLVCARSAKPSRSSSGGNTLRPGMPADTDWFKQPLQVSCAVRDSPARASQQPQLWTMCTRPFCICSKRPG